MTRSGFLSPYLVELELQCSLGSTGLKVLIGLSDCHVDIGGTSS